MQNGIAAAKSSLLLLIISVISAVLRVKGSMCIPIVGSEKTDLRGADTRGRRKGEEVFIQSRLSAAPTIIPLFTGRQMRIDVPFGVGMTSTEMLASGSIWEGSVAFEEGVCCKVKADPWLGDGPGWDGESSPPPSQQTQQTHRIRAR